MVTAGAQGPGAPGIDCVYLAEDELTPLLEIAGVLRAAGSPVPLLFEPQVMMTVDGVLSDVLDLTDVSTQHALGTTHQELTGSWVVQQSHLPGWTRAATADAGARAGGFRRQPRRRTSLPFLEEPEGHRPCRVYRPTPARSAPLEVFNQPAGTLQQSLP